MPAIFATIIASLVQGQSIATVLGALSAGQWGTLITGAAADLEPALARLLGLKSGGNSIGSLIDSAIKAAADDALKDGLRDWISANADAAMRLQPGMGEH